MIFLYRNDNTARKINQDFEKNRRKVIKLNKVKKINKLRKKLICFCFAFSAFSITLGGIFYFLFGQAKLNELTYKTGKNLENSGEKQIPILEKKSEENIEKSGIYATEDKAVIY